VTVELPSLRVGAHRILRRDLTETEVDKFSNYLNLLVKWQNVHRLLGSSEPGWIVDRIFLDSLLFLRVLPPGTREILDVGSGAGVPGIPLKLVIPDLRLTMVESRQRRASFLSTAVRELSLRDVRVIPDRLESMVCSAADRFDAVVARCAGDVGYLFGLSAHLARPGGVVIASGPPEEHHLPVGEWITTPGVNPGETRRFAVYHVQLAIDTRSAEIDPSIS
jgi:16S rRNA (guanine527-N7)-methyltransferase